MFNPTSDAHEMQDLRWLRAAAAGDRAAFAQLYRRYHPRLVRFLARMSQRRDLVDEVINDTLWVVWRKCEGFRGDSKVSTWITGIAYRCMLKALRDRVSREPADAAAAVESAEEAGGALDDEAIAVAGADEADLELRQWVHEGMRRLNDDQRVTLELVYVMGESCEGVAAIMGCAVGTVKARLFHARMRLRNLLPALGEPNRTPRAGGAR